MIFQGSFIFYRVNLQEVLKKLFELKDAIKTFELDIYYGQKCRNRF